MLWFQDYGMIALMPVRMYITSARHSWDGALCCAGFVQQYKGSHGQRNVGWFSTILAGFFCRKELWLQNLLFTNPSSISEIHLQDAKADKRPWNGTLRQGKHWMCFQSRVSCCGSLILLDGVGASHVSIFFAVSLSFGRKGHLFNFLVKDSWSWQVSC